MKKIITSSICCLSLLRLKDTVKPGSYMSIQYAVSFASGDMGEFISAPSFRGALLEYGKAVTDNVLVGVDFGWNVFDEKKDYATYTSGPEALSGVQYRYQNELPMLVSADYMIATDKPLKPYVGLAIGTMYSERSTDMNL